MNDDQDAISSVDEEELMPDVPTDSNDPEEASATAALTVIRGGVESDDEFTFKAPATIGRFDPSIGPVDVDLGSLPEAVYVSRKHALITCEDGLWKIQDMGSSNGTFILRDDFERVEESEIQDGDQIALGNARLKFRAPPQIT